jgi:H+-transporting ATPase
MESTVRGLTGAQVKELTLTYGPNEIQEKKPSMLVHILRAFLAPASLMLVVASGLSFFINRAFDGCFILALLLLNVGISFWHEHKADTALDELRKKLAVAARVLRDGKWSSVPSRELVPGDWVECGLGSLVPADLHIDEANNLQINEAVLTGESLPKEKKVGDTAYSGSVVMTGKLRGVVTATGNKAFFGKIATSASGVKRRSTMERDILAISRFLIVASLIAVVILTTVFIMSGQPVADILLLDLSLLIAGIPISLPTVMTLIVSIGALEVAKENALVRRLASLEDFANVTLLLTDKTGTLTKNQISAERVHVYGSYDEHMLLSLAGAASEGDAASAIEKAIIARTASLQNDKQAEFLEYTPADSVRKRTTALVRLGDKRYLVSMGMPPILQQFSHIAAGKEDDLAHDLAQAAEEGARGIAVAVKENPSGIDDEKDMQLAGVIVLSDPLRDDAAETLAYLRSEGVKTIMVTGDTKETASHVSKMLGMLGGTRTPKEGDIEALSTSEIEETSVFAEVLPDDKLALIGRAQKDFIVAMAGDGVNDLPAVHSADVGMAVESAVDALKGTADIVFLAPGISVMRTSLIEARKIFFRLYNYSIYRISESFRLVVTVLLLGLIIKGFPLTPVQIILLAFLNDIPIITMAFDRVKRTDRPAELKPKDRFVMGALFGLVGVCNSMLLYFLLAFLHAPLSIIQTAFFLKLTVSGHMLIYVAHTRDRWWRFLPARSIIVATTLTQLFATGLAIFGIFVSPIPVALALFIWVWSFGWMQVTELTKVFEERLTGQPTVKRT